MSTYHKSTGYLTHSLVVCEKVVNDRRGYHIADAVCFAMTQGLKGNAHALPYLIEAGATCTTASPLSTCFMCSCCCQT